MDPGNATRWKLYAEAFRAWVPIVVSLCAISLTIFQAAATRRHMKLGVQPRVGWLVQIDGQGEITYSLINNGFGPAILTELNLKLDGEVVGPDGPATCAEVDRRLGREGDAWDTGCFDMESDYVIRAGDTVVIYASRRAEGAPGLGRPLAAEEYLRLTPEGRYCSFYEDCWPLE
jgi:hypothetical protein